MQLRKAFLCSLFLLCLSQVRASTAIDEDDEVTQVFVPSDSPDVAIRDSISPPTGGGGRVGKRKVGLVNLPQVPLEELTKTSRSEVRGSASSLNVHHESQPAPIPPFQEIFPDPYVRIDTGNVLSLRRGRGPPLETISQEEYWHFFLGSDLDRAHCATHRREHGFVMSDTQENYQRLRALLRSDRLDFDERLSDLLRFHPEVFVFATSKRPDALLKDLPVGVVFKILSRMRHNVSILNDYRRALSHRQVSVPDNLIMYIEEAAILRNERITAITYAASTIFPVHLGHDETLLVRELRRLNFPAVKACMKNANCACQAGVETHQGTNPVFLAIQVGAPEDIVVSLFKAVPSMTAFEPNGELALNLVFETNRIGLLNPLVYQIAKAANDAAIERLCLFLQARNHATEAIRAYKAIMSRSADQVLEIIASLRAQNRLDDLLMYGLNPLSTAIYRENSQPLTMITAIYDAVPRCAWINPQQSALQYAAFTRNFAALDELVRLMVARNDTELTNGVKINMRSIYDEAVHANDRQLVEYLERKRYV